MSGVVGWRFCFEPRELHRFEKTNTPLRVSDISGVLIRTRLVKVADVDRERRAELVDRFERGIFRAAFHFGYARTVRADLFAELFLRQILPLSPFL